MQLNSDNNGINLGLLTKEITGVNISTGNSYNYASIYAKISDGEYVTINYEWNKTSDVPEFILSLMTFIKGNKETAGATSKGAWVGKEDIYIECSSKRD